MVALGGASTWFVVISRARAVLDAAALTNHWRELLEVKVPGGSLTRRLDRNEPPPSG